MPRYDGKTAAQEHLLEVAKSMIQAAYKAPLTTGRAKLQAEIVTGDDLVPIIEMLGAMAKISQFVAWDYMTLKETYEAGYPPVLVLIGADATISEMAWNCGACGFPTCKEFNAYARENLGQGLVGGGPSCNWKILDVGIACDWAAAAAWQHNVDNRVQGSTGSAAKTLGYLPEASSILGISVGPCKELVWYSREVMNKKFTYEDHIKTMFNTLPINFLGFAGSGKPAFKSTDRWWEETHFINWGTQLESEERMYEVIMEMAEIVDKYGPGIAAKYKK
ncbi:DUF2148 domain-containing protein [Desulfotruncus alcoholivorax]|uniref:DUF2148 domain-containing protein n=1 Tax=Desulfotruncus alcoholivorax TaxID=265477 RepID=UPI0004045E0F|nr:DUF2148 domain-containing protein [Desulfotruncus alcoholivorax]